MLREKLISLNRWTNTIIQNPIRRFQISLVTLLLLTIVATVGYMLLEKMNFSDALYMTVITVTTVGFGEVRTLSPEGRMFTIILIILGVGAATNAISNAIGIVVGPLLWASIRRENMERDISRLNGHHIVCGYGRMGRQVISDLKKRGEPFVLIDSKEELEEELIEKNIMYIFGDATRDEVMLAAGIKRARGLVAALNTDPDNVMTVLTARELNPQIFIVARVGQSEAESKLRRAGANRVVSPYQIGGHRIALALIRPAVNDFLDSIFHFESGMDIDIGELYVAPESPLANTTIATCGLRDRHNISVLGIREPDGSLIITPGPSQSIAPGAVVIVIGPPENIYSLESEYANRYDG